VEVIGSKQSNALRWCKPNNDDGDELMMMMVVMMMMLMIFFCLILPSPKPSLDFVHHKVTSCFLSASNECCLSVLLC